MFGYQMPPESRLSNRSLCVISHIKTMPRHVDLQYLIGLYLSRPVASAVMGHVIESNRYIRPGIASKRV